MLAKYIKMQLEAENSNRLVKTIKKDFLKGKIT